MGRKIRGNATVLGVIFFLLCLTSGGLCVYSLQKIQDQENGIVSAKKKYQKAKEDYDQKKFLLMEISNLVGFYGAQQKYIFSIEDEAKVVLSLNGAQVPDSLKQAFQENKIQLSERAKVKVHIPDKEWFIEQKTEMPDGKKLSVVYIVSRGKNINVYGRMGYNLESIPSSIVSKIDQYCNGRYLFSLDKNFKRDLLNQRFSEKLREEFQKRGCHAKSIRKIRMEAMNAWLVSISDGSSIQKYRIILANEKLHVYVETITEKKLRDRLGFSRQVIDLKSIQQGSSDDRLRAIQRIKTDLATLLYKCEEQILRLQNENFRKARMLKNKEIESLPYKYAIEDIYSYPKNKQKGKKLLKELTSKWKRRAKQYRENIDGVEEDIVQIRQDTEKIEKEYKTKIENLEKSIQEVQSKKLAIKEELAQITRKSHRKQRKYKRELEDLDERIGELQAAAKVDSKEKRVTADHLQEIPDGEIIYVDDKSKTAYINLGRSDGVLKGLTFKVLRPKKGGGYHEKAEIVVRKIEGNMSKVGIVKVISEYDPIIPGDKILNEVYDKNKIKYFVLAGRFQKYSMEEANRMVEKIRGKIEKKISAKTDFVILGEGFRKDPVYTEAKDRGIETILESEFLKYLQNQQ